MGGSAKEIIVGVATGGLSYGANYLSDKAAKQRREARTLMDQQRDEQRRQEQELKKRRDIEATNSANVAARQAMMLRRRDLVSSNRPGTILTGPLGVTGSFSGGGKTLLGA